MEVFHLPQTFLQGALMKVIGINGSPRKTWNSAQMLDHALNGAKDAGAEIERIDLCDLHFSGCQSCFACKLKNGKSFGRCAIQDELTPILDKILNADAVIFAMPIYFGDVPGMVRNLFERIWFPSLMYQKDGASAYTKRVKAALLYTMNVKDESYYSHLIDEHHNIFSRFLGETYTLCATDTLQYDKYDRYVGDMFCEADKRTRHDTQFPIDCQNAYNLGQKLAKND